MVNDFRQNVYSYGKTSQDQFSQDKFNETFVYNNEDEIRKNMNILNIKQNELLTLSLLKKKRNELSLMYHPDKGDTSERMVQINNAFEILKQYLKNKKD